MGDEIGRIGNIGALHFLVEEVEADNKRTETKNDETAFDCVGAVSLAKLLAAEVRVACKGDKDKVSIKF